jgi:Collagen triple helix repeat (20 copies)
VRRRIKAGPSPSMVVACIAVVLALTGSAFAAQTLITGADIKDGSVTRADLSRRTVRSLKGKRGKTGPAGRDGFAGPQGPQGSTGPEGPRGPVGPAGPQGQKGTTGDTGAKGDQCDQGDQGDTGDTGAPGQFLVWDTVAGPQDAGTALATSSPGPDGSEGTEVSNGGTYLMAGRYKVDVLVSFVDTNATDPGAEYGVARLFLRASGQQDATTLVTPDIPDDQLTPAQASGSFLVNVGDDGGGGEQITLRAAIRSDVGAATANVSSTIIVTRIPS